jgi:hypothetical protein
MVQPISSNIVFISKTHKSTPKPLSIAINLLEKEFKNLLILSHW